MRLKPFCRPLRALALAVSASVALVACASGPQPGPTAVPIRPTESAEFEVGDIESVMSDMVDAGAPAVLVEVRSGDQVWSSASGVRSTTSELPVRADDRVRIASLTKPMVAAIVLQLIEEGEVGLDDPIEDYLPGIVDGRVVTVRSLLNHTSGMPDYVPVLALDDPQAITSTVVNPISHEALIDLSRARPWSFEPGTQFEYSNTNYIVISMLIEELTDKPLAQVLAERIAGPLGLTHTSIPEGTGMGSNYAHGYFIEGPLAIDVTEQDASLWSGAGGVVSTVSDVNTFMRALLTGQVVAPELLGEMLILGPHGYGLGVQARVDSCSVDEPSYLEVGDDVSPSAGVQTPPASQTTAATAPPVPTATAPDYGLNPEDEGSGSRHDSDFGELVQIGEPGFVYGHLGSGLGYRALTMSSPDGIRQVTVSWTVSPSDYAEDPRLPLAYELADVALQRDC